MSCFHLRKLQTVASIDRLICRDTFSRIDKIIEISEAKSFSIVSSNKYVGYAIEIYISVIFFQHKNDDYCILSLTNIVTIIKNIYN